MYQPSTIVLVGSSRIQMDVDPEILAAASGVPAVVQLGITGSSPLPVLRELADDPAFIGRVVCEVIPPVLFGPAPGEEERANRFVAKLAHRPWVAGLETTLRTALQTRVSAIQDGLQLDSLPWKIASTRSLPKPMADEWMRRDRFIPGRFRGRTDLARLTEGWRRSFASMDKPFPSQQLEARFDELGELVRRIRGRGGDVAFVRMPSSGPVRAVEQHNFPRANYWDAFAQAIDATTIHVDDVPKLAQFECAEGSHLDASDVPAFSRALADALPTRWKLPLHVRAYFNKGATAER